MTSSPSSHRLQELCPIIFEDTHVLVIEKSTGVDSQGGADGGQDGREILNVVDLARRYLGRHYVGLIHRLDRNTTGLMVLAKRSKAASRLSEALRDGRMQRSYQALVMGALRETITLKHRLKKDVTRNVVELSPEGKPAILHVRPLEVYESVVVKGTSQVATLVELSLETGRSHQIRVQLAAAGHPLWGDTKYGGAAAKALAARPLLHSSDLEFPHPMQAEQILRFHSGLPTDMRMSHVR